MEITMIRHTSVALPRGICYGWTDVPVADSFLDEAAQTLRRLRPLMPFDRAYTSPLTRARMLAAYCGYADAIQDERLREMNMGDWEMQPYDQISDPHLQEWYDDFMHQPTTNGESFPQLYHRVASFLDDLRRQPLQRVAIFAHGGVLVAAAIHAGLFPADNRAFSHLVPYGGIQQITV